MLFGAILVVIGAVLLLQNLGVVSGDVWGIIWPSLIVVLGLSLILKKYSGSGGCKWCGDWFKSKKEKKGE